MVQFSSVAQSCLTLCYPMNRSTPGLPVHHQLPEFTQAHVHRVSDAIQPSHPLSSPSLMFDLAAAARSKSLSWNRAWGRGSPGATGEGGQRPWSAAGAGQTREAQGGCRLLAGVGEGFPVVLSEMATAAGNAPGAQPGWGKPGPSWRAEGLLFLLGLESNPGSSLQTEEEAGLP